MALSVALVGEGIAALAAHIATQMMTDRATGIGDFVAVVVSLLIGYPAGVAIGIILVRKLFRWNGSVVSDVSATILGAVLTLIAADLSHLKMKTGLLMRVYSVCVAVGAATGVMYRR